MPSLAPREDHVEGLQALIQNGGDIKSGNAALKAFAKYLDSEESYKSYKLQHDTTFHLFMKAISPECQTGFKVIQSWIQLSKEDKTKKEYTKLIESIEKIQNRFYGIASESQTAAMFRDYLELQYLLHLHYELMIKPEEEADHHIHRMQGIPFWLPNDEKHIEARESSPRMINEKKEKSLFERFERNIQSHPDKFKKLVTLKAIAPAGLARIKFRQEVIVNRPIGTAELKWDEVKRENAEFAATIENDYKGDSKFAYFKKFRAHQLKEADEEEPYFSMNARTDADLRDVMAVRTEEAKGMNSLMKIENGKKVKYDPQSKANLEAKIKSIEEARKSFNESIKELNLALEGCEKDGEAIIERELRQGVSFFIKQTHATTNSTKNNSGDLAAQLERMVIEPPARSKHLEFTLRLERSLRDQWVHLTLRNHALKISLASLKPWLDGKHYGPSYKLPKFVSPADVKGLGKGKK